MTSDDLPTELAEVDIDDAAQARIEYLCRDSTGITETEAERIVRFAHLPRDKRDPSHLRIMSVESKAPQAATSDRSDDGTNGSEDESNDVCGEIRRRMRSSDRTATVVDAYPNLHPSAIFRHAEGRCACDTDVPATTSPPVKVDECADMRSSFRSGASKRDVMADFHRSANAVNKHLFGRCDHPNRSADDTPSEPLSKTECGHLRESYRANSTVSVRDIATAYGVAPSTSHKHLRGVCRHDVDVDPIAPGELDADTCESMRRSYKRREDAVVASIAREHGTTRPTADYHIFGRCGCDADESAANRR